MDHPLVAFRTTGEVPSLAAIGEYLRLAVDAAGAETDTDLAGAWPGQVSLTTAVQEVAALAVAYGEDMRATEAEALAAEMDARNETAMSDHPRPDTAVEQRERDDLRARMRAVVADAVSAWAWPSDVGTALSQELQAAIAELAAAEKAASSAWNRWPDGHDFEAAKGRREVAREKYEEVQARHHAHFLGTSGEGGGQ